MVVNQEKTQEEVEVKVDEGEIILLGNVPSGFQGDEHEKSKNNKVCSLITNGEKENTVASLLLSKLHESKLRKHPEHSSPFLTHSEPLLAVQGGFEGPSRKHPLATPLHKHFHRLSPNEVQGFRVFSKTGLRKIDFKTKKGLLGWLIIF